MMTTMRCVGWWLCAALLWGCSQASGGVQLSAEKDRCESQQDCVDGYVCTGQRCVRNAGTGRDAGPGPHTLPETRYLLLLHATSTLEFTDYYLERFRAVRELLDRRGGDPGARFKIGLISSGFDVWPLQPGFVRASEVDFSSLNDPASILRTQNAMPDLHHGLAEADGLLATDMALHGAPDVYRVLLFTDGMWAWTCCTCEEETGSADGTVDYACERGAPVDPPPPIVIGSVFYEQRFCDGAMEWPICNNPPYQGAEPQEDNTPEAIGRRIGMGNYARLSQLTYLTQRMWNRAAVAGAEFQMDVAYLNNVTIPAEDMLNRFGALPPERVAPLLAQLAQAGGGRFLEVNAPDDLDFVSLLEAPLGTTPAPTPHDPFPGCLRAPCDWHEACDTETRQCVPLCGHPTTPAACPAPTVCDVMTDACVARCDQDPAVCTAGTTCFGTPGICRDTCYDFACLTEDRLCAADGRSCEVPSVVTGCPYATQRNVPPADTQGPVIRVAAMDGTPSNDETLCAAGERLLWLQVHYTDVHGADVAWRDFCGQAPGTGALVQFHDAQGPASVGQAGCTGVVEVASPSSGGEGAVQVGLCYAAMSLPTQLVVQVQDAAGHRSNPACVDVSSLM